LGPLAMEEARFSFRDQTSFPSNFAVRFVFADCLRLWLCTCRVRAGACGDEPRLYVRPHHSMSLLEAVFATLAPRHGPFPNHDMRQLNLAGNYLATHLARIWGGRSCVFICSPGSNRSIGFQVSLTPDAPDVFPTGQSAPAHLFLAFLILNLPFSAPAPSPPLKAEPFGGASVGPDHRFP
jgi:hypothetical protein